MSNTSLLVGDAVMIYINDITQYNSRNARKVFGFIRFIGFVSCLESSDKCIQSIGIELIEKIHNGHDGTINNTQYFNAKNGYGIIVPITNTVKKLSTTDLMLELKQLKNKDIDELQSITSHKTTAASPVTQTIKSNIIISKEKSEKYAYYARIGKLVTSLVIIILTLLSVILYKGNQYLCINNKFGDNNFNLIKCYIYKSILLFNSTYNVFWTVTLLFLINYAKQLHHIQIDTIGIYGFRAFSIPSNIEANNNKCAKSISEIFLLPGTSTHFLFLLGSCMSYTLILTAVLVKINEWNQLNMEITPIQWISVYLFLFASFGMLMVAWWTLENNNLSKIFHYFGACCVVSLYSIAFMLYQNISLLSIILLIAQFLTAIFYFTFSFYLTPNEMLDPKQVHIISYRCILSEIVTCSISMVITNLYLFCMDGDIIL